MRGQPQSGDEVTGSATDPLGPRDLEAEAAGGSWSLGPGMALGCCDPARGPRTGRLLQPRVLLWHQTLPTRWPPGVVLAPWKLPLGWLMFRSENSGLTQACKQVVLTWLEPYMGFRYISPFYCPVGGRSPTHRVPACLSPQSVSRVSVLSRYSSGPGIRGRRTGAGRWCSPFPGPGPLPFIPCMFPECPLLGQTLDSSFRM